MSKRDQRPRPTRTTQTAPDTRRDTRHTRGRASRLGPTILLALPLLAGYVALHTPTESGLWAALAVILPLAAAAPFVGVAAYLVVWVFKGAGETSADRVPDLTNVGVRIGDGAYVLRFGLETQTAGRPAFRAETRRVSPDAF